MLHVCALVPQYGSGTRREAAALDPSPPMVLPRTGQRPRVDRRMPRSVCLWYESNFCRRTAWAAASCKTHVTISTCSHLGGLQRTVGRRVQETLFYRRHKCLADSTRGRDMSTKSKAGGVRKGSPGMGCHLQGPRPVDVGALRLEFARSAICLQLVTPKLHIPSDL
ncbi:hypothetical protein BDY21DRAFT_173392 [Lineolata rhizophorae]|uniref:Uncharacterized protein n=1 Tax=Lineolata rhizophorae TaxID=578093 RepID=A0A6A6NMD1_9PEZI|nr:hypothetical protein BDY21DRAFT_173392 [Lineolata rhizophorae]